MRYHIGCLAGKEFVSLLPLTMEATTLNDDTSSMQVLEGIDTPDLYFALRKKQLHGFILLVILPNYENIYN